MSQAGEAKERESEVAARREGDSEASRELTRRIAEIAAGKGATDFVALDVRELVGYTDYMLVCTARNERQAKAIHDEVYYRLKHDAGRLPASVEGERTSTMRVGLVRVSRCSSSRSDVPHRATPSG